ncbi:MAG TPA: urease subunit beta [Drouetiella sp.]
MKPGEYFLAPGDIDANEGAETVKLEVSNSGDRPIQVGSHFHFFESNRALVFDRELAFGKRLNIASGTAVRFEAGQSHTVELVAIGGSGNIVGFNGLVQGSIHDKSVKEAALKKIKEYIGER